jgi:hypothetical protein
VSSEHIRAKQSCARSEVATYLERLLGDVLHFDIAVTDR